MGPEGGSGGGLVVAEGTPEHVATVPASYTGQFLREILDVPAAAPARAAPRKVAAAKTSKPRTVTAKRTTARSA